MNDRNYSFKTDTVVDITSFGHRTVIFDAWKYWEIVGELSWRGASRVDATDAGKWCMHAEPGIERKIDIPEILLRVRRKKKKC